MQPMRSVPGVMRTVFMKPSMRGLETASRCFASHGPMVVAMAAALAALSATVSSARFARGGSMLLPKEGGRESPSWKSGT